MNKLYSVHDHWTDINKKNDVDIESIDGVITRIKVNGEDYGGGGSSWQIVFEGSVTTTAEDNVFSGEIEGLGSLTANTIKVTFNGVEYACERDQDGYYGAPFNFETEQYDWSEFPFVINTSEPGETWLITQTAGTYTLKIEEQQSGGGESDFSTAQVTVINTSPEYANTLKGSIVVDVGSEFGTTYEMDIATSQTKTANVIMYKGNSIVYISDVVSTSGAIQSIGNDVFLITGDCTITIAILS